MQNQPRAERRKIYISLTSTLALLQVIRSLTPKYFFLCNLHLNIYSSILGAGKKRRETKLWLFETACAARDEPCQST